MYSQWMYVRRRENHTHRKFFLNTLSAQIHLIGAIAMAVGALPLLTIAGKLGPLHYWACFSFIFTGIVLFLVSATYHFLSDGFEASDKLHFLFESIDHFCIYLFIAGTYSPFLLNGVTDQWKVPLLFGIWSLAIAGISYTLLKSRLPKILRHRFVYTSIFFAMGCTLLIRAHEVYLILNSVSLRYLLIGCLCYTVGALVYATKSPILMKGTFGYHELWHSLVLFGAVCHYVMIYSFYSFV